MQHLFLPTLFGNEFQCLQINGIFHNHLPRQLQTHRIVGCENYFMRKKEKTESWQKITFKQIPCVNSQTTERIHISQKGGMSV